MNAKHPNLRLEPLSIAHLPHVMKWVNDKDAMQYFAARKETITEAEELAYIEKMIQSYNDIVYSVFDGDQYIGQCSINAIYWPARNGRIFLVVTPEHQHKGYGSDILNMLINTAFELSDLHKLWLICRQDNVQAQAMYLRAGFRFEGLLKDEYFVQDRYFDMVRMGVLNPKHGQNLVTKAV